MAMAKLMARTWAGWNSFSFWIAALLYDLEKIYSFKIVLSTSFATRAGTLRVTKARVWGSEDRRRLSGRLGIYSSKSRCDFPSEEILLDSLLALLFEKPCPLVAHTDFSLYNPSPIRKWKTSGLTTPSPSLI
jgi:hypothetical protein